MERPSMTCIENYEWKDLPDEEVAARLAKAFDLVPGDGNELLWPDVKSTTTRNNVTLNMR